MLAYQFDNYNGVIIEKQALPNDQAQFISQFNDMLFVVKAQGKQLIWFTLCIKNAAFIQIATDAGFVFHNCLEDEITLILRIKKDAYAPFVPTHSIGAGALIFNQQQQILVIREKIAMHSGFKLPGGHIELGEKISEAIVREVFEETGIQSEFVGLQGFASKKVFRFGKSNIYFLCRLNALTDQINIQDIDEIAEAKWCDVTEFINDTNNSVFVREIVKTLQYQQGFQLLELPENNSAYKKHEVFFAANISNKLF
ncbi:NUDIX hydrolase [Psychromonas hadalis]|uniref:NUDIX hydrolase n=1 Tax=Psychromonas hadalis TaxID=211669 RepID=UPI0003B5800D|nr:NUDIX domain-containing protein [Psychromonas hadalis]